MDSDLKTAVLIDGSDNPVALRIKEGDKLKYISQGRAGDTPRNFEFVKPVTMKVNGEERTAFVYKLVGAQFDDFDAMVTAEVDKHLNPEKYAKITSKPLNTDERAELERLRKLVGK